MKKKSNLLALILATVLVFSDAGANTYSVGNNSGGPGPFTLYEAITQANSNPGADTIDLSNVSGTIILTGNLPMISGAVTIRGDRDIEISGFGARRILRFDTSLVSSFNVEIDGVFFADGSGNEAFEPGVGGGAIMCTGDIDLTVRNCVFSANSGFSGGAILAQCFGLRLENCTLRDNSAASGGAVSITDTNLVVRNCTFSNNTATIGSGGAVSASGSGNALFDYCTVVGNKAATRGGGLSVENASSEIRNSVFSDNASAITVSDIVGFGGVFVLTGTNHRQILDGDPLLGPLDTYHSPIPTYCLLRNSPLRDRIAMPPPATTDARGFARPQNGLADIG